MTSSRIQLRSTDVGCSFVYMTSMSGLEIGSYIEGMELRSVGNSHVLRESALVEAFNLKVIIKLVRWKIA